MALMYDSRWLDDMEEEQAWPEHFRFHEAGQTAALRWGKSPRCASSDRSASDLDLTTFNNNHQYIVLLPTKSLTFLISPGVVSYY
jgi:hypothetical protein